MGPPTTILLKNGTLLLHDEQSHVTPTVADLLITGSRISKIGSSLQPPDPSSSTEIIDCTNKIISPGFVDTHHHLWQTQFKGWHANHSLVQYMARGNFMSALWTAEDLFWGQLAGALEAIDAGTTTVVDHSSCNTSPAHSQAAVQALVSSGLRAVYCYTPARRIVSRKPFKMEDDFFSEENIETFHALAKGAPYGRGRVEVGYAMDNVYLPSDILKPYYADLRDETRGKAKLITTHTAGGAFQGNGPSVPQILEGHGLLGPDVLLSHGNWPKEGDWKLYRKYGAHVSSTPNTELQMGRFPVAMRDDHYGSASLGVDCHTWGAAGMTEQMRLCLQSARAEKGGKLSERGLWSRETGYDVERVFNLATLGGAKAAGLEGEVGRLEEGYKADIAIFEGRSVGMLAAAVEDPVAAVVMHSSPGDVEMVIIDGVVRKKGGKLMDVDVVTASVTEKSVVTPGTTLRWSDIAEKVLESREVLKKRAERIDHFEGEEHVLDAFHADRTTMLEAQ